jgi:hypothetical protein
VIQVFWHVAAHLLDREAGKWLGCAVACRLGLLQRFSQHTLQDLCANERHQMLGMEAMAQERRDVASGMFTCKI